MKFDPTRLQDASLAQLTQALIDRIGPFVDAVNLLAPQLTALVEALAILEQLNGRILGRELPPSE